MSVTRDPTTVATRARSAVGRCRHCGRVVQGAVRCRACGYDADRERNRRDRFVWGLLGALLVGTVVGAPLGFALCWKAVGHHRAMTGDVVARGQQRPLIGRRGGDA